MFLLLLFLLKWKEKEELRRHHSTPAQLGNKMGHETGDKSKKRPKGGRFGRFR